MVVIAIIAILASLLLPALNRARGRTHSIACLNNLKQLQYGWHMYADDNEGYLPPNNTDFSKDGGISTKSWCPGNARTDLTTDNIRRGALFPYIQSTEVYRCPADKSHVETEEGALLEPFRTRSYGMSSSINYDSPGGTIPSLKRFSAMVNPPPHMVFVFVDVNENSITDARFELYPDSPKFEQAWVTMPSDRHNLGGNMSFADGHVEHWNWEAPKKYSVSNHRPTSLADIRDLRRMQDRVVQDPF
jgi:prepilin-type processing-associated H-X9-DG protein